MTQDIGFILGVVLGAGFLSGLPWFLIVSVIQRWRKNYFCGWRYFFAGASVVPLLTGLGLLLLHPTGMLLLVVAFIWPLALSILATRKAYALTQPNETEQIDEGRSSSANYSKTERKAGEPERYHIRTRQESFLPGSDYRVEIHDQAENLLLASHYMAFPNQEYQPLLDGITLFNNGLDDQPSLKIRMPKEPKPQHSVCAVFDCQEDEHVGSLSIEGVETLNELFKFGIRRFLIWRRDWLLWSPNGECIGRFHTPRKVGIVRWGKIYWDINVNDQQSGRVTKTLFWRNYFARAEIVPERVDRRMVLGFAAMRAAFYMKAY